MPIWNNGPRKDCIDSYFSAAQEWDFVKARKYRRFESSKCIASRTMAGKGITMTAEELQALHKYGRVGSWAIWNKDYKEPLDTQVIFDNVADLHAAVVIVGLNVSGIIRKDWGNFRAGKHDRKLCYAFNDSPYRGAYITDLIKDHVEEKSGLLMAKIETGMIDLTPQVEYFVREMEDVGASSQSLFILLGNAVQYLFQAHLSHYSPNTVKVRHYSCHGTDLAWVESTWITLEDRYRASYQTFTTRPFFRTEPMEACVEVLRSRKKQVL